MLNFETRVGPDFGTNAPTYPDTTVNPWFRDAKLGFFIHWGLYSVPAWGTPKGQRVVQTEDAYTHHQYAEWYGNTVRIQGSPTHQYQETTYGVGTSYEDLADLWDTTGFDANNLVGALIDAGGRYVIPTTKHHDGFCLWDTGTTPFNSVRRGPRRDLIGEIVAATRARGAKVGLYYSGALDWHISEFPPIESDTDLFRFRRNDKSFSRFAAAQLEELVEKFEPDILWNDIDWPDGGKGTEEYGLAALLNRYYGKIPHGVINDRWGIPVHGYLTREYSHVPQILAAPWEATRGLGASFGFNQNEGPEHTLSQRELIHLLIDVVAKNGNLLLNVGPRADGSVPEIQLQRLRELGAWMAGNGEAIYGTRPWTRFTEDFLTPGTSRVTYTSKAGGLYVHAMDPAAGAVCLPPEYLNPETAYWLTSADNIPATVVDGLVQIPDQLRGEVAAVLYVQ